MNKWRVCVLVSTCSVAGITTSARAGDLGLNAYGDIDYLVNRQDGATSNSFQTPRFELFATASQDRLSFLAEAMFEAGEDNGFGVDVERVEVGYLVTEQLRLRVGRFHTAIGYYNDSYHHGRYFQTTVDRPLMTRFEDEGGLLPAHAVGVHLDGRFPLGGIGALRYDAEIANGRGRVPDEVTNVTDPNNGKMLNLRLRIEPSFLDGLVVGGNVLWGGITALNDPAMPTGATTFVRELMLGGHVAYLENNFHVIAEYLAVVHGANEVSHTSQGAFLELGYTVGRLTPYVRGEWIKFPQPGEIDPFYAQNALFILAQGGSLEAAVVGLRITVSDFIALKLEGQIIEREHGSSIQSGAAQCAFAF